MKAPLQAESQGVEFQEDGFRAALDLRVLQRPDDVVKPVEAIGFIKDAKIVQANAFTGFVQSSNQWAITSAYLSDETQLEAMKGILLSELGDQGIATARDIATGKITGEMLGRINYQSFMDRWTTDGIKLLTETATQLIFEQNISTAMSAADWIGATEPAHKEIVEAAQYFAIVDDRTRPDHEIWDGSIHRLDSPFWNNWWPPNGFRCRCTVAMVYKESRLAKKIQNDTVKTVDSAGLRSAQAGTRNLNNVFFPRGPGIKIPVTTTKSGRVFDFNQNAGKLFQSKDFEQLVS